MYFATIVEEVQYRPENGVLNEIISSRKLMNFILSRYWKGNSNSQTCTSFLMGKKKNYELEKKEIKQGEEEILRSI